MNFKLFKLTLLLFIILLVIIFSNILFIKTQSTPTSLPPSISKSTIKPPTTSTTSTPTSTLTPTSTPTITTSTTTPIRTPKPKPVDLSIIGDIASSVVINEVRDKAIELAVNKLAKIKPNISSFKIINAIKKSLPNTVINASKILKNTKNIAMGIKAAMAAIKAGITVSTSVAKMVTKLTGGPLAAALLLFDVINMAIDAANVNGVAKFDMSETYDTMYKNEFEEIKKMAEENNWDYPSIIGPLTNTDDTESQKILHSNCADFFSDISDPLLEPFIELLVNYESQYGNDPNKNYDIPMNEFQSKYNANYTKILQKSYEKSCLQLGGIYNNIYDKPTCSYTKEICNNKSNDQNDFFYNQTEFKDNGGKAGKACVYSSNQTKQVCEAPYAGSNKWNPDTKICEIDKSLCRGMGGDSQSDGRCTIPGGQALLETIFGTTLVREMKTVFDPKNFTPCNNGEIDDGYTCRKLECPDGLVESGGFCYPPCKSNYTRVGLNCYINCPDGTNDDGLMCSYCGDNPSDSHNWNRSGLLCDNARCPDGWTKTRTTDDNGWDFKQKQSCYKNCPDGFTFDPKHGMCRDPNISTIKRNIEDNAVRSCPDGYDNVGANCHRWIPAHSRGYDIRCPKGMNMYDPGAIGKTKCYWPCPEGYMEGDGRDFQGAQDGRYEFDGWGNATQVLCKKEDANIRTEVKTYNVDTKPISSIEKRNLPGMNGDLGNIQYQSDKAGIAPKTSITAKKRTDAGMAARKQEIQKLRAEYEKKIKEDQQKK